jgi:hypothetical protein
MDQQEIDAIMQLNQRNAEIDLQKGQRDVDETLRTDR